MDIFDSAKKEMLVAAHRGSPSGIIPCNTLAAYDAAIAQGADIVEIDVTRAMDGTLFVFHPHMEKAHLNSDREISQMTAQQVRPLRYVTYDRTPTRYGVSTLDEVFEHLKGRCFINIDKLETDVAGIARTVRRHCLHDQVIAKTWSDVRLFQQIEALAPDLPYMAMNREQDTSTELVKSMKIRYLGTEVMFSDESSPLCKQSYVERMHAMGYLVWCNAIVFDPEVVFAAGHNDETASLGRPEQAWGWLADLGYDIMQTDCAGEAVRYLKETGKKYRA
jgi:glycerophosphoryl diester phosphodiesterase